MSNTFPVLVYQKIGRAPQNSRLKNQWVSPRQLEKMLTHLGKRGYTFITPPDLQKPLPAKPVMLVFMGGYQSFYSEVFPLLQARNIRATVLVAVEALGTYNSWQNPHDEPWQPVLTVKQLQTLAKSPLVCVGTLGLDGHNLLEDEPGQAQAALQEAMYRLQTLHKIAPHAVGFWPSYAWNSARAQHITQGICVPVITSQKGLNPHSETRFLRTLRPTVWTRWLLK